MKISQIFLAVALFFVSLNSSFAAISFSVTNEDIPKTKILFFGFDSTDPSLKADTLEVMERIRRNLKTTDLFEIIKQSGKVKVLDSSDISGANLDGLGNGLGNNFGSQEGQKFMPNIMPEALTVESTPDFEKYRKAGISAIVIGSFNYDVAGNMEVRIRTWDVLDQRQLFGKFYSASQDNYRKMANAISDEIFKSIAGEKSGHFNSKILYVSQVGSLRKPTKKVNIVDFDGENHHVLTTGRELVLTPIFSKRRNEIFYLRYFRNKPQIFSLDLRNLKSQKVGGFHATTFAASVHPKESNIILLSAIIRGNSDIYKMNLATNTATRLTKNLAIDTTASYSPDGKYIAFASDRDAGQQLYIMDADGDNVRRISVEGGSYSTPVWSPDGNLIAFTKVKSGKFHIGVMSPGGRGEKLLVSAYSAEGPKWSPNGRYIIYSKKRGRFGRKSIPRLYIIDITTGFEFEVPTPSSEGATDPDWV